MATFDYREDVARANLLPAIGVGLAVGLAAGYVANLLLRRAPLPPGDGRTRLSSGPPRVPIVVGLR